jgi:tetratricopeptide (TPR) repeat protein
MADTFAREGDDRALRTFYQEKITAFGTAPISAQERIERIAAMRRALIPVLTRAKDTAAAVDQYIEIINRYPEDTALIEEAASYARQNQQQQRLTAYYEKTAAASPRDFRWPLVLARVYTSFEDYPAAITMYTKAGEIRPDRSDIFTARGTMEERLLRFDDAATTFTKVYDLTYRSSVWMERIAEIRARQGRAADTIAALRTAYLEGRSDSPQPNFDVADRLDRWGMTAEAVSFAERGVTLAGAALLNDYYEGAQTYARILTKVKRYAVAHAKAPQGQLLMTMAGVVRTAYTAQEKTQFAAFLDKVKPVTTPEVGRAAGLPAWEARRTQELLIAKAGEGEAQEYLERLRRLQRSRLAFTELGGQLEAYAAAIKDAEAKPPILALAADTFQQGGDEPAELRVRTRIGGGETRYLRLLARRNPKALLARAEFDSINAALDDNKQDLVMQLITAKGASMPPVWTRAYSGLAGLYFAVKTPEIETAFQEALGSLTIGERIGKQVDTREQITGNLWYYYGARYGEYLDTLKKPEFDDLMPAIVEGTPGSAQAYFRLGEYYRETNRAAQAIAEYENTLQLDVRHVASLDRIARLLWAQNKRDEAKQRWRQALDALRDHLEQRRQPPSLSEDLRDVLEQFASRQLLAEMRPALETVVTSYIRRYGAFNAESILRHFDVGWMVAVSRSTSNPVDFLTTLVDADWIPLAQKEPLYERILESLNAQVATAVGDARDQALNGYYQWQSRWVEYLLDRKLAARAQTVVSGWNEETRERLSYSMNAIEMRIAAQTGRLEQLLAEYRIRIRCANRR